MTAAPEPMPVYVVDDDASLRNSLRFLLANAGRRVISFESGEEFLTKLPELGPGTVLLDVGLAGMDGLSVQRELDLRASVLPIIIMTGGGDVPTAVAAMKAGAVDFLLKPFAAEDLFTMLGAAEARLSDKRSAEMRTAEARAKLTLLSHRELEVLNELARGLPNKAIGGKLAISSRTVEVHRANAMRKLGARSFPDALKIAFEAGLPLDLSESEAEPELSFD